MSNKSLRIGKPDSSSEAGFTLIETMIALLILTVGLLGVAAAVSYAITASNMSRNVTDSKLLIVAMLEQMENLRNTRQLTFGQIANEGAVVNTGASRDFAGFETGFQPISTNPGRDGIYGTSDDLREAGPNGTWGDSDDVDVAGRTGYTREVVITNLNPYLKKVQVTVRYPGRAGNTLELVGISYLNNDARGTFRR